MIAAALLLLLAPADAVVVRTNVAFAPCVSARASAYTARTGQPVKIEIGDTTVAAGADVVIGDDSELTRLLEGGTLDPAVDVGTLPWVLVTRDGGDAVTSAARAVATEEITVPGGLLGREAREYLGRLGAQRLRISGDAAELLAAGVKLVPRSLAGAAPHLIPAPVRPLVATAGVVRHSPRAAAAASFVSDLSQRAGSCFDAVRATAAGSVDAFGYARAVADWWLPQCTLDRNRHNNPNTVVGSPDGRRISSDNFSGMFSLGQGGWVVVEAPGTIVNGPGPDIRVYQMVSGEPVTVYASMSSTGPWSLAGLREYCGNRSPGITANNCEFDLANAGLAEARFVKVEDGELYPCLAGSTFSEGSDIDAVLFLNTR